MKKLNFFKKSKTAQVFKNDTVITLNVKCINKNFKKPLQAT